MKPVGKRESEVLAKCFADRLSTTTEAIQRIDVLGLQYVAWTGNLFSGNDSSKNCLKWD